jgi:hypothetical protein
VGFSAPIAELPPLFADRSLAVAQGEEPDGIEVVGSGGDLRDAVDRGIDLIRTGDPDLLEYARLRPALTAVPLAWDRSYLLVLPARSAGIESAVPADTAALRAGLGDAVRTDARIPEPPYWWEQREACVRRPAAMALPRPLDAVVYPASDTVARELAERIVAIAETAGLAARGLPADSFAMALRAGRARAFVVAVPRHAPVACRETAAWAPSVTVVPLIETRAHAILRRGTPPVVVEWDGALRPVGSGERSTAAR